MDKIIIEEDEYILLVEPAFKTIFNDLLYFQAIQYIKMLKKELKCYRVNQNDLNVMRRYGFINLTLELKRPELWVIKDKNIIERISDFQHIQFDDDQKEKLA